MKKNDYQAIAHFIYEAGMLAQTPRSGHWFLGNARESVAEHLFRTAIITYALCSLEPIANRDRAVLMALFHDFGEARVSDLNHIHQKYGRLAEARALDDMSEHLPSGAEIRSLYQEEVARETLEAKLVKEADELAFLTTLREEEAKGNAKAKSWSKISYGRLKTPLGKKVGKYLMKTGPDSWWFDKWFATKQAS